MEGPGRRAPPHRPTPTRSITSQPGPASPQRHGMQLLVAAPGMLGRSPRQWDRVRSRHRPRLRAAPAAPYPYRSCKQLQVILMGGMLLSCVYAGRSGRVTLASDRRSSGTGGPAIRSGRFGVPSDERTPERGSMEHGPKIGVPRISDLDHILMGNGTREHRNPGKIYMGEIKRGGNVQRWGATTTKASAIAQPTCMVGFTIHNPKMCRVLPPQRSSQG